MTPMSEPARGGEIRVSQNGCGQPLDAFGIADRVDLDDLVAADGEGRDGGRAPVPGDDDACGGVDEGGMRLCGGVAPSRAFRATVVAPRIVFGERRADGSDDQIGGEDPNGVFSPGVARAQRVETDPGDDGREPAGEVFGSGG
jgi:hypothetical protein